MDNNVNGLANLKAIIEKSPFNRTSDYSVNVDFKNFFTLKGPLAMYNLALENRMSAPVQSPSEIIKHITPVFQRENTKWSQSMQRKFVENLLSGCESRIQLYEFGQSSSLDDCYILDGLQRLTAMAAFQSSEFPVFDRFYWDDISKKGIFPRLRLTIHIFCFATEKEACEFYITMNRGITHNESDLEPACQFLQMS